MILTENYQVLRSKFPEALDFFSKMGEELKLESVKTVENKNNKKNVTIEENGKIYTIHSQYDPIHEADQIINKIDNIEDYQHVFFYGVGLGYHIENLLTKHPHLNFTLYEPKPAVMYHYFSNVKLDSLPLHKLKNIYLESNTESVDLYLNHFLNQLSEKVLFVILPVYERIIPDQVKQFTEMFIQGIIAARARMNTNYRFERLWTLNSMQNFATVINSQNLIREKKDIFQGKPVIIAAAGPSLEDEFDNLRQIKDQGLAYIFSVGSANKALLSKGIYPDAVCAYDPETGYLGLDVFGDIIEQGIDTIPLIFGSTLGHITVDKYPGPKLHIFINQDTVSPFYLEKEEIVSNNELISDAPSIAVVTLEFLAKLGCNPIILVGQNLGFRNEKYYAPGIQYNVDGNVQANNAHNIRPNELTETEKKTMIPVDGVDGAQVYTNKSMNQARAGMEQHIAALPNIDFVNTTRGGAAIKGTKYKTLDSVISEYLTSSVVNPDWYAGHNTPYNKEYMAQQAKIMDREFSSFTRSLDGIVKIFQKMDKYVNYKNVKGINKQFQIFDKEFGKLQNNHFFKTFIHPMIRVQHQILVKKIPEIRHQTDIILKSQSLIELFGKYIVDCHRHKQHIESDYLVFQQQILGETSLVNS